MATSPLAAGPTYSADASERRFFAAMAAAMAATIVAGFSIQLAMGRSSFAVPWIYHLHAVVFFTWVFLFLTQTILVAGNNTVLHRRLGVVAAIWVPLMVVLGFALLATAMRRTGAPFFFDQNEFLFSNPVHLLCFAGLTFAALKVRRHTGWHRRLMLCGFAILTGPGLGRLLPLPLLIPHAWKVMVGVSLVWIVIGMVRDRLRTGAVHPAWLWGAGSLIALQIAADIAAYSHFGISLTEQFLAGTPGAERPMQAFLPLGFAP